MDVAKFHNVNYNVFFLRGILWIWNGWAKTDPKQIASLNCQPLNFKCKVWLLLKANMASLKWVPYLGIENMLGKSQQKKLCLISYFPQKNLCPVQKEREHIKTDAENTWFFLVIWVLGKRDIQCSFKMYCRQFFFEFFFKIEKFLQKGIFHPF